MVHLIDPLEDPRWPALLQAHPDASVFHSRAWLAALRRTYAYQPVLLTTAGPGEPLRNGLVFCRVNSWLTGRRWVSLPFSDHTEPLVERPSDLGILLDAASERAVEEQLRYLEIRPIRAIAQTPARAGAPDFVLHTLDLSPSIDTLFNNLHEASIQRKIRRAEREALVYSEGRSDEYLEAFYRLMQLTRKRHAIPPQPPDWFRNLAACFGSDFKIRLASHQGRAVAAMLTLRYKSTLIYKYGCSEESQHPLGGMQLLMWRSIQEAKEQSLGSLDLGRSEPEHTGLITYKNRWGAECINLSYFRQPDRVTGNEGKARKWKTKVTGGLFSKLPNRVNSLVGRALYRHMG